MKERLWTRSYVFMLLAVFGMCLVTNMFNLGMTYYADLIHGGIELAGVSAGAFSLAALISKPLAAWVCNRFDNGRVMAVMALAISVASYCHGYADTILALAFIRVIHGVLFGIFSTSSGAAVNIVLPRSRLSEGLGFYAVVSMLVPAVGPGIFLLIVEEGSLESFEGLFVLSFAICVVTAAVAFFGLPAFGERNVLAKRKNAHRDASQAVAEASADTPGGRADEADGSLRADANADALPKTYLGFELKTLLPAGLLCLFCMAFSSVNFYLPELAFDKDLGDISMVYPLFAIATLVCRFLIGGKSEGRALDKYLYFGMICLTASYIIVPFCRTSWELCLVAVPLGAGMGLVAPYLNCYIVSRCSKQRPGSAAAAYYAAYDLGYAIGAFAAGAIIAVMGYSLLYWISAVICVVGLALFRGLLAGTGAVSERELEEGVSDSCEKTA